MTDVFYVAVKGSLHASDCSVFGLNSEEIAALSKRFSDIKKEVINGVLVKASPIIVINSLSELGYRVTCSSGEADIVWTLRREVLNSLKSEGQLKGIAKSPARTLLPSVNESNLERRRSSSISERRLSKTIDTTEKQPITKTAVRERPFNKKEERIGSKPEDLAEYLGYSGSRIIVTLPEDVENVPEGQKIIIKTNASSQDNPMLTWNPNDKEVHNLDMSRAIPSGATCIDDMSCTRPPAVPSVHQTMEEMDFERGLWYPALTGDLPRIRTLLQKGHNPNEEDKNGYTALHYASRCGFTTICTQLLEAGASVNKATRAGGATALHRAALAGNDDTVTILIKYGGNLLTKDADGRIPLHRAVESNQPTTVALLLEASPESVHVKDRSGKTAHHYVHPNNKVMHELFDLANNSSTVKGRPSPPPPQQPGTGMNRSPRFSRNRNPSTPAKKLEK